MMGRGFVDEVTRDEPGEPHPGLERNYYALKPRGRKALALEAARLRQVSVLAERRLGRAHRGS